MNDFTAAFDFISVGYIVSVIVSSYAFIQMIIAFIGIKKTSKRYALSTIWKKIITTMIGLVIGLIYVRWDLAKIDSLIPSFFIAIVGYDYLIKEILIKLGILKSNK